MTGECLVSHATCELDQISNVLLCYTQPELRSGQPSSRNSSDESALSHCRLSSFMYRSVTAHEIPAMLLKHHSTPHVTLNSQQMTRRRSSRLTSGSRGL